MWMRLLTIALGGALGALARYAVSEWFVRRFPAGTLLVNVVGCLLIGLVMGISIERAWLSHNARLFFVTGFLGALTTFSTFGWQTYSLAEKQDFLLAGLNVALNVVLGLVAVAIGVQLGAWLGGAAGR
jgi:fluoride exporter